MADFASARESQPIDQAIPVAGNLRQFFYSYVSM